ncbi:MAG TPA: apolipoprotein N-acyltransferase [Gammaproteobacteria bacterium]
MKKLDQIIDLLNRRRPVLGDIVCVLSGLIMPLGFAPFEWRWIPVFSLAVFIVLLQQLSTKKAAFRGFVFGLGMFGCGISWVYNSLHDFGSASVVVSVLITVALVTANSACLAGGMWLYSRYRIAAPIFNFLLLFPAAWIGVEWFRSWILTGFPWLLLGYTQIDTVLAGYAPLAGTYAIGFLLAVIAGACVMLLQAEMRARIWSGVVIVFILSAGSSLQRLQWVEPTDAVLQVSLIQGNIPQEIKLNPEYLTHSVERYQQLSRAYYASDLIVWPETAIPDFRHRIDASLQPFYRELQAGGTDLLTGIFSYDFERRRYYNSLYKAGSDELYHKQHLVPFGEYMPLRWLLEFMNQFINIPMSDISPADNVGLMSVAGHIAGASICYESAYADIFRRQLPQAEFFVNVSNDAWFGDSLAPHQHLEMARMRALEFGRYILRATNNGISAIIDAEGKVLQRSPQFREYVVTGEFRTISGRTPYAVTGNRLIIPLLLLIFLNAVLRRRTAS